MVILREGVIIRDVIGVVDLSSMLHCGSSSGIYTSQSVYGVAGEFADPPLFLDCASPA